MRWLRLSFFFQAEDGIRDYKVTGVQTCALPIYATVRSDIRVQAGKLTDVVVNHRAAVITLKLVNERGGEALANTQWSVLTPGGDVVKEASGAFPKVILAEGEYSVVARNEGRVYNGKFKVEPGFDREIEVLSR